MPRHRGPSAQEMQRHVELFNHGVKEGDSVTYKRDTGELLQTRTRSSAFILSGHTPVVFVDGVSGCVLLDRVSAAPTASTEPDASVRTTKRGGE
jgi:hypothetical protein